MRNKDWIGSAVIDYCTEEVRRQGHDIFHADGFERVGWMLEAWAWAVTRQMRKGLPTIDDIETIGQMVEVSANIKGFRRVPVRVGHSVNTSPPAEIISRLGRLWERRDDAKMTSIEFYKEFELIHPFVDGNGRTGKILLNWRNGTLLNPIFPPDNLWGPRIQNP